MISDSLRSAVPNSTLDLEFVTHLAEDPALEWSRRVRDKASRNFDEELREPTRHPELLMRRLFRSPDVGRIEQAAPVDDGFFERIVSRVPLIPSLPAMVTDQLRGDSTNRRDDYRQLALFTA